MAIGHKTANPDSIVISYQGDGDLASIGLAEIVSTAQLGIPITVIFVNNAIYGMTGGQMAPTTLMGQHPSTSPAGRMPSTGQPMKMAELIAGLDGPVYVERVALFDNKQRTRAKKAIKKAIELQVAGRGFTFVEVLSECPTHLGLDPEASQEWVKNSMVPVFPLGVKKDLVDGLCPKHKLPPKHISEDNYFFKPANAVSIPQGNHENRNLLGRDVHDFSNHAVHCHTVSTGNHQPDGTRIAEPRTLPFHADDAVNNIERWFYKIVEVEKHPGEIFFPGGVGPHMPLTFARGGHAAEHILYCEGERC